VWAIAEEEGMEKRGEKVGGRKTGGLVVWGGMTEQNGRKGIQSDNRGVKPVQIARRLRKEVPSDHHGNL